MEKNVFIMYIGTDCDIKLKEEYLKCFSRLLNFVKPDTNYYLK